MNKNINKNNQKEATKILHKNFQKILKIQKYEDISIWVGKGETKTEIKAHKIILTSRSEFFKMFLNQEESSEIYFPNTEKTTMEWVINYIYTGKITLNENVDLVPLLLIANHFQLDFLSSFLEMKIIQKLSKSNVCHIFHQNDSIQSTEINKKCLDLIDTHFSYLKKKKSFLELEEEDLDKIIQFKITKNQNFTFPFFQMIQQWIQHKIDSSNQSTPCKEMETKRLVQKFISQVSKTLMDESNFRKLKKSSFFSQFLPFSYLQKMEKIINKNQNKQKIEKIETLEKEIQQKDEKIQNLTTLIEEKDQKQKNSQKKISKKWIKKNQSLETEIKNLKLQLEEKNQEIQEMLPYYPEKKQKENEKKKEKEELKSIKESLILQKSKNIMSSPFRESIIIIEDAYVKKLKKWINDKEFFYKMKLGYSAKRDGFDCEKWHEFVDNKGKTLIIIKTKDSFIFGGFTQIGFIPKSKKKWIFDENAFLFSLKNLKGNSFGKFSSSKKSKELVRSPSDSGPDFGDFSINSSDLKTGQARLFGSRYCLPDGIEFISQESKNYLAGCDGQFFVEEIECYFVI